MTIEEDLFALRLTLSQLLRGYKTQETPERRAKIESVKAEIKRLRESEANE